MTTLSQPRWSARIWEDGSFSLGYIPPRKIDENGLGGSDRLNPEHCDLIQGCIDAHGVEETLSFVAENPEFYPALKDASPLDLTTLPKSHSVRAMRGQAGISTHGKKLVRNATLRLEREAGTTTLTFLTLTVPGLEAEGALTVVENWAEIVRVFQQRLKRMLERAGLPGEIVGVTEVQEKRFAASDVVALHLHLVFQGRRFYGHWAYAPSEYRAAWKAVLSPYLEHLSGELYWDACENCVPIKYSAVGYLGKYLSKGAKTCELIKEAYPDIVLPKCWYICSNSLRLKVKRHIAYLTSKHSSEFEFLVEQADFDSVFYWVKQVRITLGDGREVIIGYVGRIRPEFHAIILNVHPEIHSDVPVD